MLETSDDAILCKIFVATLTGPASLWLKSLPPNPITSFQELSEVLIQSKQKKTVSSLFNFRQQSSESLRHFIVRFKNEIHRQAAAIALKEALLDDSSFLKHLVKHGMLDVEYALLKVGMHICLADQKAEKKKKEI